MKLKSWALVLPLVVGFTALADEPGPKAKKKKAPPAQSYDYDEQDQQPAPIEEQQPPLDPSRQYYCNTGCAQAPLPPPVYMTPVPPPIIYAVPRPVYPFYPAPPILPPWGGPRPMPYGGGGHWHGGPRPMPYGGFRRMSLGVGCEIQRGNNGEVVVLSNQDAVIYLDKSADAERNAQIMKAYYEKSDFGLCDDAKQRPVSQSI